MSLLPLTGTIQHYDWGGASFIPDLLGIPSSPDTPYAEYWMGTHPKGDSVISSEPSRQVRLSTWISEAPVEVLGARVSNLFSGKFPFLFKVLDVKKMLSIQAHPNRKQAIAGFERENKLGIPLDAFHRNYRDANHKPEIMVALTPFWLLHGFREKEEAAGEIARLPGMESLARSLSSLGMRAFYELIMTASQEEIDAWLEPLAGYLFPLMDSGKLDESDGALYWAARAMEQREPKSGKFDRGIFSIFLFNLVHLSPGEGIFQEAGIPHAYLEGVNVELMANSDNVFRGGLTPKHIDIPELLQTLRFDPVVPEILRPSAQEEKIWELPPRVPDFSLARLRLEPGETYAHDCQGPEVILVMEGEFIDQEGKTWAKGQTAFAPHGEKYRLRAVKEGMIFKAGCGIDSTVS